MTWWLWLLLWCLAGLAAAIAFGALARAAGDEP